MYDRQCRRGRKRRYILIQHQVQPAFQLEASLLVVLIETLSRWLFDNSLDMIAAPKKNLRCNGTKREKKTQTYFYCLSSVIGLHDTMPGVSV